MIELKELNKFDKNWIMAILTTLGIIIGGIIAWTCKYNIGLGILWGMAISLVLWDIIMLLKEKNEIYQLKMCSFLTG